ncbi:MAG: hypothetical protein WA397_10360 [Roseiarcus sp.]
MSLIEEIEQLPRKRRDGEAIKKSTVAIPATGLRAIRVAASQHNVAIGDLVEYAVSRLLSELASSKPKEAA